MKSIFLTITIFVVTLYANFSIIEEVDRIHKLTYFHNISIKGRGSYYPVVIQKNGDRTLQVSFERYLNNSFNETIKSRDLIVVKSGRLRGVGVLITMFYKDENIDPQYKVWLPAIRKIRTIKDPLDHNGFGVLEKSLVEETKLRDIDDEIYSILEEREMKLVVKKGKFERGKYSQKTPQRDNVISGNFYIIEATPKRDKWYSRRESYIEKKHLLEYKTIYFNENEKEIATIYRDFIKVGEYFIPNYRYSKNEIDGTERVIYIPKETILLNRDIPKQFWSEQTLRKLKR